jgi:hypothetical protein
VQPRAPSMPFDAEDRPPSPPSHATRHMTSAFGDERDSVEGVRAIAFVISNESDRHIALATQ